MSLANFLFGRPISTDEDEVERVGPLPGVGVLGLDALASAAYGPEALLTALIPLGHGQTAALLRHQLRARGGPHLVIVNTPWYLRDWLPERHWLSSFARRLWRRRASAAQS